MRFQYWWNSDSYGGITQHEENNNLFRNIASADLRDWAKLNGWSFSLDAIQREKVYLGSNPNFPRRRINFPIESSAPDYVDAIESTIIKIAEMLNKPVVDILSGLQELRDDTIRYRVINKRNDDAFIPLSYAVSAINGAKEMLAAAACTVLKPQYHHPRMNRSEALELVEKSKFRQTEKGSFVLKVSSPIKAMDIHGMSLFGDDTMPFVRQTTLTINKGVSELVTAIQTDTLDYLVDSIKNGNNLYISSNLCKAVTSFQEEQAGFDLVIGFKFAGTLALPFGFVQHDQIRVDHSYFSRIEDVRRELRNSEQQKKKDDIFAATVEHLAGEINDEGTRSGQVILNLLMDDEIIKAKTELNAAQYKDADIAHMTRGAFIKIKGQLHPGNQPRNLTDISMFELIQP